LQKELENSKKENKKLKKNIAKTLKEIIIYLEK